MISVFYQCVSAAEGPPPSCGATDRKDCSSVDLWLVEAPASNINLGRNAMSQLGP